MLVGLFDVSEAGKLIQHFWTRRPIFKVSAVNLTHQDAFSTTLACLCVSCHSLILSHQCWHAVAWFGLNEPRPDALVKVDSFFSTRLASIRARHQRCSMELYTAVLWISVESQSGCVTLLYTFDVGSTRAPVECGSGCLCTIFQLARPTAVVTTVRLHG